MKTECSLCSPKQYGTLELTTYKEYWDMLNCVPPKHRTGGRFAVGEEMADRWQFGGEFPDATANHAVYACYFAVEGNGYDETDTYVCGYFTLLDYIAVNQAQLRAVATSSISGGPHTEGIQRSEVEFDGLIGIGDQIQSIETNWQGRVTGFQKLDGDDCTYLVCHHVSGGKIEEDDKRWFDPRDVRLLWKKHDKARRRLSGM